MTKPAAFQAMIHGFRTVPSRGVVSITIEAPIEQHAEIARIAVHGAWVAVARLQDPKEVMPDQGLVSKPDNARPRPSTPTDAAKRPWLEIPAPQRAGIRVGEALFSAFLREERPDDWHETQDADDCLKLICNGIESKRELATNQKALLMFNLLDSAYDAWKVKERVGA